MSLPNLETLKCSYNNLTSLPENILDHKHLPKLESLICCYNNLTSLPEKMDLPNLETLDCCHNNLTSLPNNMNFQNLQYFYCSYNKLTSLPDNLFIRENFPNLTNFYCSYNNLTSLPDDMNLPNLESLRCSYNNLTSLPENMNFPNLESLNCSSNNLTSLPLCIMRLNYLTLFKYENNEIDNLPIQLLRFINRLNNSNTDKLNIYNDGQNVHDSNILLSIKESIERLTIRTDIDVYNKDELIKYILKDDIINCKEQLIEYINDESIHSLLLLSFAEVLWFVIMTINKDFDNETQKEIKKILNQDMGDALCKCFTGRISRVINCLSGFSDLVDIKIKDESQIGNIIVLIKEKLGEDYSVEEHRRLVINELQYRGFDNDVIEEWVSYIE
jgi:hypothetical protein